MSQGGFFSRAWGRLLIMGKFANLLPPWARLYSVAKVPLSKGETFFWPSSFIWRSPSIEESRRITPSKGVSAVVFNKKVLGGLSS